MKFGLKRIVAFVLCLIAVAAILPAGTAYAATSYSMYSNKTVKLQIPGEKYLFDTPMTAKVKGVSGKDTIFILPKPETGNGDMGTVKKDARVVILAEKNEYYLFMTTNGKLGWNKKTCFTDPTEVTDMLPGKSGISADHIRAVLDFLKNYDEFKCGAVSKDFYTTRAVVVVGKGETETITFHGKWTTTYYQRSLDRYSKTKWSGNFDKKNNCKINISGKNVGSELVHFTNDHNAQEYYVLVLVT